LGQKKLAIGVRVPSIVRDITTYRKKIILTFSLLDVP